MATKKKLLQAAAGSAGGAALNVEDVFSTYLYNGTATNVSHQIQNGIDLAGEGGLVWIKKRDSNISNTNHHLVDTERGDYYLASNSTNAQASGSDINTFNSDGWTFDASTGLGTDYLAAQSYASWTFRKHPKFFDVQTFTTTYNNNPNVISHNLESDLGCAIFKQLNSTGQGYNWIVWHRSLGLNKYLILNGTNSQTSDTNSIKAVDNSAGTISFGYPMSNVADRLVSGSTETTSWVGYFFAHNNGDGEFGPTGDQDIIKCGSYTGTGTAGLEINLGFEPQWFLMKRTDTAGSNWFLFDVMRGFDASGNPDRVLRADTSEAEGNAGPAFRPIANGVEVQGTFSSVNASGGTYIYIAIRRGPMAVPESATDVFAIDEMDNSPTAPPTLYSGFPVDMAFYRDKSTTSNTNIHSRLTGTGQMQTNLTASETSYTYSKFDYMDGWFSYAGALSNYYSWMWRRAPSYFDAVAYTGNGVAGRTVSHNLGVVPEMMWVKSRSNAYTWVVYHKGLNGGTNPEQYYLRLDTTGAEGLASSSFNDTAPTASNFTLGIANSTNGSGNTYIAYLFASLAGVSKVGSYTGTGSAQNIDCGFSSGARFVLLKRTDSTGDWMVYDSTRGITSTSNDPALSLNNTDAEFTENAYFGADVIRPHSSGFTIDNYFSSSGHTYIFYAIA